MDLKSIAKTLADIGLPLLGAALPLPGGMALGGMLAAAVDDHLGGSKGGAPVTLDNLVDTLTQNAQAKEAALEFQARHQETILKITVDAEQAQYAAEVADRQSARDRETKVQDKTPRNLAYLVILGFLAMVICTLAGWTKVDSALAGTLVGYVSAKCEQAMAYYFGSTHSSMEKTRLLAAAPPPGP